MPLPPHRQGWPVLAPVTAAGLICLWAILVGWVLAADSRAGGPATERPESGEAAGEAIEPEEAELDYLSLAEGHRQAGSTCKPSPPTNWR